MNRSQISFKADPAKLSWRVMHGIPANPMADYVGYTGPKLLDFPTSKGLDKNLYPDITEQYNELLSNIVGSVHKNLGKNKLPNFFKKCMMLGKNFKTADKWDTKFMENFPGRTKDGKVQYALFRGKVVTANVISNTIYAETLVKLKFKKWLAIFASHVDACGLSNLMFEGRLPSRKTLAFKDTIADQHTIKQAFLDLKQNSIMAEESFI